MSTRRAWAVTGTRYQRIPAFQVDVDVDVPNEIFLFIESLIRFTISAISYPTHFQWPFFLS
jgi:hypothetical protein